MDVNCWILAGVAVSDHIYSAEKSCWKRPDLVNVPDILKYSEIQTDSGIKIYENNIGVAVLFIPYGKFVSKKQMERDYCASTGDSLYITVYKQAVEEYNNRYKTHIVDFDWVMPVLTGKLDLQVNYCTIPEVESQNKPYIGLIDCSMVYTSVRMISDFVHLICNKKKLTKYQRWQLAYYQMAVQSIESPKLFLVNKEEITIYSELYRCWQIDDSITAVISNMNQAVTLFSFLVNYEDKEDDDLFSGFLTFFGIIVGLEAIYNLFSTLLDDVGRTFKIVFALIIAASILIYGVIFSKKVIGKIKDKKEFNNKTKK